MSNDREEGIEKYLKALAHRVRREIIRTLAEKKSLSYSELMKITGVEESGTFAFHIKMLQGLIEKDPKTGEYRLTEEGWRAYRALQILSGEEKLVTEGKKPSAAKEIITVSDKLEYVLSRNLAEKLCSENKKLYITDVLMLKIEDMPEELLECVLEGIEDVFYIDVPDNLKPIVQLKSGDVGFVGKGGGFIGGLVSSIMKTVTKSIAKSLSAVKTGMDSVKEIILEKKEFKDIKDIDELRLSIDASHFKIDNTGEYVMIEYTRKPSSRVDINREDNRMHITIDNTSGKASIPLSFKDAEITIDSSSISGRLNIMNNLKLFSDASNLSLEINELKNSNIHIESDSSNMKINLVFREYSGESSIILRSDSSNIGLNIIIPKNVRVKASMSGGYGYIIANGEKTREYVDPGFDKAESKLIVRIDAESSVVKTSIKRI
jgi:DNA-binding transcriptional ArsR family regulator